MKFKQKIGANHKYSCRSAAVAAGQDPWIFFTLLTVIMIFMNAVVSVNTSAVPTPAMVKEEPWRFGVAATTTMLATLDNNTRRNPIIAEQSSKTSAPQKQQPVTSIFSHKDHGGKDVVATTISAATTGSSGTTTSFTMSLQKTNNITHPAIDIDGTSSSAVQPLSQAEVGNCKSLTSTWGDVDPNIYYLCDMERKQPIRLHCPDGRGYFNGLGYAGCIPYEQWPACVAQQAREQVHTCDSDHMQQPWEAMNPNKFYICLQEAMEPMLLNCGQGKGFVHVHVSGGRRDDDDYAAPDVGDGEIVGCANWEKWRRYMQCTDYY
uniref:Chitin-binding type-2 domain-containing protein n=1 Tax=Musca domestica TaxID=7370 RepID=A0A1I8NL80_MUSDO